MSALRICKNTVLKMPKPVVLALILLLCASVGSAPREVSFLLRRAVATPAIVSKESEMRQNHEVRQRKRTPAAEPKAMRPNVESSCAIAPKLLSVRSLVVSKPSPAALLRKAHATVKIMYH
eukprot:6024443-Pleurochrysis_carterae.AAC.1